MPHIILEYSSNLATTPTSPISSTDSTTRSVIRRASSPDRIKSRAVRTDTYHVGADRRGFVHATVLFSPGRPEALRRQVGRLLGIMRSDAALGGPTSPPASRSGSSSRGCTSPSGIADQVACWARRLRAPCRCASFADLSCRRPCCKRHRDVHMFGSLHHFGLTRRCSQRLRRRCFFHVQRS